MGVKLIQESTLTDIANAIREKKGTTDALDPANFATEISSIASSGGDLTDKELTYTGDCSHAFYTGRYDWIINKYGNKITTKDITNANRMFYNSQVETIPFPIHLKHGGSGPGGDGYFIDVYNMFSFCRVKELPLVYYRSDAISSEFNLFTNSYIERIPDGIVDTFKFDSINKFDNCKMYGIFKGCVNLRYIPSDFLKQCHAGYLTYSWTPFYQGFYNCYRLGEIVGIPGNQSIHHSSMNKDNAFKDTFYNCCRVKRIVFSTDNGVPYTMASWHDQIIDLSSSIGYGGKYYSGTGEAYEVTDDATYQALKDNPDWWTKDIAYSRYNHDSAVETINSLPDNYAYIAANNVGNNTIKFKGAAGSATDGGAINTLTEEEIAVAAAKGWTVTLV